MEHAIGIRIQRIIGVAAQNAPHHSLAKKLDRDVLAHSGTPVES
jgi:hypothetical protein